MNVKSQHFGAPCDELQKSHALQSNQATNWSSVHKGVKTTEGLRLYLSQVSISLFLLAIRHSNMTPPRQQSQSLASPLFLSAHTSPQDEANPLHAFT